MLQRWRMLGKGQKVAACVLAALVIYSLIGFLLVPYLLRDVLEKELAAALSRPVTVEAVRLNPLTLHAWVDGVDVLEPDGSETFVSFSSLEADVSWSSLPLFRLVLERIALTDPYVRVVLAGEESNFSDLVAGDSAVEGAEEAPVVESEKPFGLPVNIVVQEVVLEGGSAVIDDTLRQTTHTIEDVFLNVPLTSTLPKDRQVFIKPSLRAKVNGKPFVFEGRTRPFEESMTSRFVLRVQDVDLPFYWGYVPVALPVHLQKGKLNGFVGVDVHFTEQGEPDIGVDGNLSVSGLSVVTEEGREVVGFDEFAVELVDFDMERGELEFGACSLTAPRFDVLRTADGRLEAEGWVAAATGPESGSQRDEAQKSSQDEEAAPFRVRLGSFALSGGKVAFHDEAVGGFTKVLEPVAFTLADVDTAPDHEASFSVDISGGEAERIAAQGFFDIAALSHRGRIDIQGFDVAAYEPYYAPFVPVKIASGKLFVNGEWGAESAASGLSVSNATVRLESLSVDAPDGVRPIMRAERIELSGAQVNVDEQQALAENLTLDAISMNLLRQKDGLALAGYFAPQGRPDESGPDAAKGNDTGEGEADTAELTASADGQASADSEDRGWLVTLRHLGLRDGRVTLRDEALASPAEVGMSSITVDIDDISTDSSEPLRFVVSADAMRGGTLKVDGRGALSPLELAGSVDFDAVSLAALEGYLREMAQMHLSGGALTVKGNWSASEGNPVSVRYDGDVSVDGLKLRDGSDGADVVSFDRFSIDKIDFVSRPLAVSVGSVALLSPKVNVALEKDGRLNFGRMTGQKVPEADAHEGGEDSGIVEAAPATQKNKEPEAPVAVEPGGGAGEASEAPLRIALNSFVMKDGGIVFRDATTSPEFGMAIDDMHCQIQGFSFAPDARAEVSLGAVVDGYAPLTISGNIVPFGRQLDTTLDIALKNLGLPALSPYTLRHIAYPLTTGKLFADLGVSLKGQEIAVDNVIRLANLAVGQRVDNPDAPNLPIGLALSLLRDPQGDITLDIPVSGRLDDPNFGVGKLVMKAIVNLFIKAVASPFSLIGSMFGGGEDVNLLVFAPGVEELSPETMQKLEAVATAMTKRPAISLEIEGKVAPSLDAKAYAQKSLMGAVKRQKLLALEKDGAESLSLADITVTADEYPEYLRLAYEAAPFEKPENLFGMVKDQPVEVMENLMRENALRGDEGLIALARKRARGVRDYLVEQGKVDPSRIFLKDIQPEKDEPSGESAGETAQVVLGLK